MKVWLRTFKLIIKGESLSKTHLKAALYQRKEIAPCCRSASPACAASALGRWSCSSRFPNVATGAPGRHRCHRCRGRNTKESRIFFTWLQLLSSHIRSVWSKHRAPEKNIFFSLAAVSIMILILKCETCMIFVHWLWLCWGRRWLWSNICCYVTWAVWLQRKVSFVTWQWAES